jgi:methyl-accepting chemotaxis protein
MGKGFAVVAGEIRSLATKSGESANRSTRSWYDGREDS